MFDFTPPQPSQRPAPPRLLGFQFVTSSGARLVLAASRLGGEEGAALASAFRDMVLDYGTHPLHWPIEELIKLLSRPAERRDAQVEQLIQRLGRLRHEIDVSGSDLGV